MSSIIRKIILYAGTTVIIVLALVMSIFAGCISQKQRMVIDWNIQSMLSNESVIALVMLCVIVSLAVFLLVGKKARSNAKLASLGIYSPIAYLIFSLFQDDIFKSVIAGIIYFALFAEIALTELVEVSSVISDATIKNKLRKQRGDYK